MPNIKGTTKYGSAFDYATFLEDLTVVTEKAQVPVVTLMALQGNSPFKVLFTTMLTARTKDTTTIPVVKRLFAKMKSVQDFADASEKELEQLIFPVGFYKTKAKNLKSAAQYLIDNHDGKVPSSVQELTKLPGVGPKTAALVVAESFSTPAICVDVHVHRISNRLGIIKTEKVEQTQTALESMIPLDLWTTWNPRLVAYGQTLCTPQSPKCSQCVVRNYCKRVGVTKSR